MAIGFKLQGNKSAGEDKFSNSATTSGCNHQEIVGR